MRTSQYLKVCIGLYVRKDSILVKISFKKYISIKLKWHRSLQGISWYQSQAIHFEIKKNYESFISQFSVWWYIYIRFYEYISLREF